MPLSEMFWHRSSVQRGHVPWESPVGINKCLQSVMFSGTESVSIAARHCLRTAVSPPLTSGETGIPLLHACTVF